MDPVARADRQPAPKLVYLEVVTTALRRLGLSEASITRSIFRGCGDGTLPYDHTGEAPPPGFWHTGPDNVRIDASDISNMLIDPASAEATVCKFTLPDVMLDWEAVGAKYPALRDTEPPELGASRIEVSHEMARNAGAVAVAKTTGTVNGGRVESLSDNIGAGIGAREEAAKKRRGPRLAAREDGTESTQLFEKNGVVSRAP